jgi:diketogulonate reductase-like aldo/keto reductase
MPVVLPGETSVMAAPSAILEKAMTLRAHQLSKAAHNIPPFLYGTAWKQEGTSDLVYKALSSGFSGIDTANQPKHYREELVGAGMRRALKDHNIKREDLYLQTKFTSISGQDPGSMPYDPKASTPEQVKASIESSLEHLKPTDGVSSSSDDTSYIDTVVLHSPLATIDETMEAWRTLEGYVPDRIRNLGVSNCNLFTLMDICERATIKPAVIQNRFYPSTKFDNGVRRFCRENSIIYQSFWTLTANPELVQSMEVGQLANHLRISIQAALYCLVLGLGNTVILNGTKSTSHMLDDFKALERVRNFASQNPKEWEMMLGSFRRLIGESY